MGALPPEATAQQGMRLKSSNASWKCILDQFKKISARHVVHSATACLERLFPSLSTAAKAAAEHRWQDLQGSPCKDED